jgi:hypothetical protein
MRPRIKATTDHPLTDPWAGVRHQMQSRVARGPQDGFYVFLWGREQVGWVYAGEAENAQRLLDMEPERSTR